MASIVLLQAPADAAIGTTVTFVVNNGQTQLMNYQVAQVNGQANLTPFASLFPNFSYTNHTFAYWSNQPGGGGATYTDGALYPFLNDATLYAQWTAPSRTVTFAENASPSDSVETSQIGDAPTSLTLFNNLAVSFSNPNFTFSGWNTAPNGTGQNYGDGALYSFLSDVILYAQWSPDSESLSFSSNTGSGNVPPLTGPFGNSVTLPDGSTLSKPNFTFTGWNTKPDGSGTQFPSGSTIVMPVAETLYAQWSPASETLSFSSNTGVGNVPPMTAPFGGSVTLPPGNSLTKSNYSFAGWNTMPDGSGTQYAPGSVISVSAGETLYATWSRNDFVVTFVTSNGTVADAPISVPAGDAITLTSPVNPIEPGYTFAGWFTAPTGGQLAGETGSSYLPVDSIVLYARWLASPEMILKFSANGGTGHVGSLSAHQGLTVVIPGGSGLLRPGFTFRGWSTTPRAGRPDVRIGAKLVLVHSRTLYALWHRVLPSTMPQVLLGSVGTFAPNSSVLTPTMRRFIASLAVGIDRHHRTTVLIYGYATSKDSSRGAQRLSLRRAQVVTAQLRGDLAHLKDVGVSLRASGEARLTNSVLASFRNVEVFAN
ncbi:MAG: OmpA family protein [Acidobacteria bacterium]|nr:OmpA family protein [Acidobacteriota bacterium]